MLVIRFNLVGSLFFAHDRFVIFEKTLEEDDFDFGIFRKKSQNQNHLLNANVLGAIQNQIA